MKDLETYEPQPDGIPLTMDQAVERAANILNVPNIHDDSPGLVTEVGVFNLKQMIIESYQEGLMRGLMRAVEICDEQA